MVDNVNILLVDDVEENLTALAMVLRKPGLQLISVRSGAAALEALLVNDIALALLDVQMPEMDGFELAELMRGSERTRHVPIIFLTAAQPERGHVFAGYEAGAVDFLYKPLDPRLLVSKVDVFAQLYRQKRQLAFQLEEIQQAQRMSDLFVGVLGHDLRNPLSNIVIAANVLDQSSHEDAVQRGAQVILRASTRMERLIQQVLDFALARVKGGIPIQIGSADLEAVTQQALVEVDGSALQRVRATVAGDPSGLWDMDRLMQAISNLIANAVTHGDPSTPIDIRIDGTDPHEVWFEVRNGGVIPEEALEDLFSPFKTLPRKSPGVGLGLYIVDQIARAHGGQVSVRSTSAEGTCFRLCLPRHDHPALRHA